jgi:hypothetical protein
MQVNQSLSIIFYQIICREGSISRIQYVLITKRYFPFDVAKSSTWRTASAHFEK